MDRILFRKQPNDDGVNELRIVINGRDLIELVREVELPFARREGNKSIAGSYAGLIGDERLLPPSKHFLGEPSQRGYCYDDKVMVLGCDCGIAGCWPLICRITADETSVVWSDFEQPHRSSGRALPAWEYAALGPFEFEREEYEAALRGAL